MNPKEQEAYAALICFAFTDNEIDHLETYANYCFEAVERGISIDTSGPLVLDTLKQYKKGGDENED